MQAVGGVYQLARVHVHSGAYSSSCVHANMLGGQPVVGSCRTTLRARRGLGQGTLAMTQCGRGWLCLWGELYMYLISSRWWSWTLGVNGSSQVLVSTLMGYSWYSASFMVLSRGEVGGICKIISNIMIVALVGVSGLTKPFKNFPNFMTSDFLCRLSINMSIQQICSVLMVL